MSEPVILIKDLSNRFGEIWVHQNLNYQLQKQEISALVGGSGSGKTTLLRSIINLHQPDFGVIKVLGVDVHEATNSEMMQLRERSAVLFQHNALFSSMSVFDNLCFALKEVSTISKDLQHDLAMWRLHQVGLSPKVLHQYPAELSGGMQKRVALARSLMLDPEVLFLDEPTAGLDPGNANAFEQLLLHLREALHLTIFIITHDMHTLWSLPDKVAFLGEGQILEHAPVEQLVKNHHPLIQNYFNARAWPSWGG